MKTLSRAVAEARPWSMSSRACEKSAGPILSRTWWWHHVHIDGAPEVVDVVGEAVLHQYGESVQRHSQRTDGGTVQGA